LVPRRISVLARIAPSARARSPPMPGVAPTSCRGLPRDWGCEAETGILGPVFPVRQRQCGLDLEGGERRS
jgi:hypothetical protein